MRSDGTITIGAKIDTKEFDKQIDYIESRMEEIEYLLKQADLGFEVGDTQKLESEYEKLSNKLIDLRKRKKEVLEQPLDDKVSNSNFEKGIEKITKRITRMGLAMIGIRSLYGMISSSASRVAENNEEIKAGMEAVNNVLDNIIGRLLQALLPVINIIAQGISFLAKELFGIDTNSNQFSNNMKSANKSATKLRKQLLGFDELNVLNKDGTIGALGGTTGSATTGNKPKDYGIYNDMSDLNKNLADLGYVAVYTGEDLKETRLQLEQLIADVKLGNATMSEKNGIVTIMSSTGNTIKLTRKEYEKLLDDINHSRVTSRNLDLWRKVRQTFVGWNVKSFAKNYNSAVNLVNNGLKGAVVTYENGLYKVRLATGETFTFTKEQWEKINQEANKNANGTKNSWIQAGVDIIKKFTSDDKTGGVKGALVNTFWEIQNSGDTSSGETKKSWFQTGLDIINTFGKIQNNSDISSNGTKKNWVQAAFDIINKFTGNNGVEGAITSGLNNVEQKSKTSSKQSADNIKDQYSGLPSWLENNVFVKLLREFGVLGSDTGQTFGKGLKDAVNKVIDKIETTINSVFTTATNMFKKFGISVPVPKVKLPRLAKGGIINQPGRGVNYGMANIGERGREGVIPLDNQSAMNTLANEISKRLVINLTNVTELDGRVIARSVNQVMNDMNFESNGGVI